MNLAGINNFRLPAVIIAAALCSALPLRGGDLDNVLRSFQEAYCSTYSRDAETTDRFIRYSGYGENAIDVLLMQLYFSVILPEKEVDRVLSLFDGSVWKDIDYTDKSRGGWEPTLHVTRILALAKAYMAPDSPCRGREDVGKAVHSAMKWWFDTMPVCPNWWHNDIGVPKKMTAALLLMKDELSDYEIDGGLRVLEKSGFGKTGQNRAWLAGNQLMKGLLTDDPDLVLKARNEIAGEICVTEAEGIQPDWSFHQHGSQLQFGNYGLAYAEGLSFWARVLDGSPYAFSDEQCGILGDFILNGLGRTVWKGFMDPSFCGRQLHIDGCRGKAFEMSVAAENMIHTRWCGEGTDTPDSRMIERKALMQGIVDANLHPEEFRNSLIGPVYYPYSDCGVYRTADWYASVRMSSLRTVGFEFTNSENLLANFTADGALLFMTDGREYDNIFGFWDWRKIPGVTAYDDGKPIPCRKRDYDRQNHSGYVTGKVSGDIMVTVMELDRDSLRALKSDFFFPDMVVALGAGIRSYDPSFIEITTAVDQAHLRGKVVRGDNYLWHNNKGYISLDGAPIELSTGRQEGTWEIMAPCYKGVTDGGDVFKCWFNHEPGLNPGSYAYAVIPGVGENAMSEMAGSAPVKVLRNDDACQAVLKGGTVCAAIHRPGRYRLAGMNIKASCPGIYIEKR